MIATALTEMFGLQHPIVLAPMGGVSGGHLAATVRFDRLRAELWRVHRLGYIFVYTAEKRNAGTGASY
jgi:hypothetical protein